MIKELTRFFSIVITVLLIALYLSGNLQSPLVTSLNFIKDSYHSLIHAIVTTYEEHFFQAAHIEELNSELKQYEHDRLLMHQLSNNLSDLHKLNHSQLRSLPQVTLARALSYQKFGNSNRVWLEMDDFNKSKIYGLTFKEYVAGIVLSHQNKPLALLNKEPKSSYSVIIGKSNAQGIAHGNNGKNIIVEFIPAWNTIKAGDEVVTSGLDNLFFRGLKVGKVLSVSSSQGYQSAIVTPYYDASTISYFYVIKRIR